MSLSEAENMVTVSLQFILGSEDDDLEYWQMIDLPEKSTSVLTQG